ncbi:DUF2818 family protein [Castellaniella caeni]|uniref:DUF2818 family protein n=1 Tax=Castellaniella caeni TaxID=266123 RepID=UPI002155F046|nr:DUF2818 family protein [Castellaniella caeni]
MTLSVAVWLVILGALVLANLPFLLERPLAPWPWSRATQSLGSLARWVVGLVFLAALALWAWGTPRLVGGAFGGVGGLFFIVKLLVSGLLAFGLLYFPGWLAGRKAAAAAQVPHGTAQSEHMTAMAALMDEAVRPAAADSTAQAGQAADTAQAVGRAAVVSSEVAQAVSAADAAPPATRRPNGAAAKAAAKGKPFIDRFLELLIGYVLVGTFGFTFELDLGNAFPQGWEFYAVTLALFIVLGYPGFVWHYLLQRRRHH